MADTPPPLNILLSELLEKNDGVFIGENHAHPALRQTLTHLMPQLHAQGVTTLSAEFPQSYIDDLEKAPNVEALKEKYAPNDGDSATEALYSLVHTAKRYGIKVIGHDDEQLLEKLDAQTQKAYDAFLHRENPALEARLEKAQKDFMASAPPEYLQTVDVDGRPEQQLTREGNARYQTILDKLYADAYAENPDFEKAVYEQLSNGDCSTNIEGMRLRNEASKKIISSRHTEGKIIVLGGAAHSNFIFDETRQQAEQKHSDGLDQMLGIPAITVDPVIEAERDPLIEDIGSSMPLTPNHFEAILPADLKKTFQKNGLTSWAPHPMPQEYHFELINPLPQEPAAQTTTAGTRNPFDR